MLPDMSAGDKNIWINLLCWQCTMGHCNGFPLQCYFKCRKEGKADGMQGGSLSIFRLLNHFLSQCPRKWFQSSSELQFESLDQSYSSLRLSLTVLIIMIKVTSSFKLNLIVSIIAIKIIPMLGSRWTVLIIPIKVSVLLE